VADRLDDPAPGARGPSAPRSSLGGEPPLPDALRANGERMDMRYVIGVLMGNRDLVRRLAAGQDVPAET
jgi:hypothetical protein